MHETRKRARRPPLLNHNSQRAKECYSGANTCGCFEATVVLVHQLLSLYHRRRLSSRPIALLRRRRVLGNHLSLDDAISLRYPSNRIQCFPKQEVRHVIPRYSFPLRLGADDSGSG